MVNAVVLVSVVSNSKHVHSFMNVALNHFDYAMLSILAVPLVSFRVCVYIYIYMASETTQVALSANRTQISVASQKVTSELIKFPGVLDIMLELCTSGTLHDAWKGDILVLTIWKTGKQLILLQGGNGTQSHVFLL